MVWPCDLWSCAHRTVRLRPDDVGELLDVERNKAVWVRCEIMVFGCSFYMWFKFTHDVTFYEDMRWLCSANHSCFVIGWVYSELTPSKRQKTGHDLNTCLKQSRLWQTLWPQQTLCHVIIYPWTREVRVTQISLTWTRSTYFVIQLDVNLYPVLDICFLHSCLHKSILVNR